MKKRVKFISQCCVCRKVRRKEGFQFTDRTRMDKWDHHKEDLEKAHKEFDVVYSHGYCDICHEDVLEEAKSKNLIKSS